MGDDFIHKVRQTILDHLDVENFGVGELALEIGLSKAQLLRKIKAISGKTISEFIREVRIKEAYKLLKETDLTASEISYQVGFSSPSYFNKCFHDYFGCTPGNCDDKEENSQVINDEIQVTENDIPLKGNRDFIYGVLITVLIVVVSFLIYKWQFDDKKDKQQISIAILPFKNLSEDKENQYFADGVMDDILSRLSTIEELRVISRTTMERYRKTQKTTPEIAKELNVSHLIESSIQKYGDTVRLIIQLIEAKSDTHIWSKDFKREFRNIFALESEIARQVAFELHISLTSSDIDKIDVKGTKSIEAFEAYAKGKMYWDRLGKVALDKALVYFEIAIEEDPDWAPPYAGIAEVWAARMQMNITPPSVAIRNINIYNNKSLELDSNSANSYYVKALLSVWTEWNWEKGEREFLKTIELNPNSARSHMYYAHLLMILKRPKEAIKHAGIALDLDPQNALILTLYVIILNYYGDFEKAIKLADKAVELDHENNFAMYHLQESYQNTGAYTKWFEYWKKLALWDEKTVASIEKIFIEQGYEASIRAIIKVNKDIRSKGGKISYLRQAKRYIKLKKIDKTLDYYILEYELHNPNVPYVSVLTYRFPELKDNQKYKDLMKKMNLPE